MNGRGLHSVGPKGEPIIDDSFYVIFNAHHEPMPFKLPGFAKNWAPVLDSSTDAPPELRRPRRGRVLEAGAQIDVQARTVVVLRARE